MKVEIKHRYSGNIILCGEYESIKDCLEQHRGADLRGAYLADAYLRGANLVGAYLKGAKGIKLPIITILGSKHFLFYHTGKIKIGCIEETVTKWLSDYKKIGKENGYTDNEIAEYYQYIKMCSKITTKAKSKITTKAKSKITTKAKSKITTKAKGVSWQKTNKNKSR